MAAPCPSCEELRRQVAELKEQLAQALRRIAELEARLGKTSRNSSRPPSTDPPQMKGQSKELPSGRKPGGQPGHEGHHRPLLPPELMDERVDVKPSDCRHCGAPLKGRDPSPRPHQVVEIPKPKPHFTEYLLHTLTCGRCGGETTADLPRGVPRGAFGTNLQGLLACCTAVYHLSKRQVKVFLEDWFGVPLSLGSASAMEGSVSEALAKPVAAAHAYVERQKVAHVDETGWYLRHRRAWLWVAVTMWVVIFRIDTKRNLIAAMDLLGERFKGILGSDRWTVYKAWSVFERQICWAHLIRDFKAFAEMKKGAAVRIGRAFLAETKLLFEWWHRVRDGTMSRLEFQRQIKPMKRRVRRLLREGSRCRVPEVRATCGQLLGLFPALWTFAYFKGVEPTNNAAERAIRPAVLWRKGCFGTQSERGNRFVERMLTVAATLKRQNRSVSEFVIRACEAALHGHRAPSLLPTVRTMRAARQAA